MKKLCLPQQQTKKKLNVSCLRCGVVRNQSPSDVLDGRESGAVETNRKWQRKTIRREKKQNNDDGSRD
jgi:hypothetical protein